MRPGKYGSGMEGEKEKALDAMVAAMEAYAKFAPATKPKGRVSVVPTLAWAERSSFGVGCNMLLSPWTCGMPGMVPVIVLPIHKASHHLKEKLYGNQKRKG